MANSTLYLQNESLLTVDDLAYFYKREIPTDLVKISQLENFRPPVMIIFFIFRFLIKHIQPQWFLWSYVGSLHTKHNHLEKWIPNQLVLHSWGHVLITHYMYNWCVVSHVLLVLWEIFTDYFDHVHIPQSRPDQHPTLCL